MIHGEALTVKVRGECVYAGAFVPKLSGQHTEGSLTPTDELPLVRISDP
jgi:hypothetical protein